MATWQKLLVLICLSLCKSNILRRQGDTEDNPLTSPVSVIGLGIVSGFGGLLSFYIPSYSSVGKGYAEISYMLSLPNLTMYVPSPSLSPQVTLAH